MVSARFRRHSRGLRNNFATPSYLRRAAKLTSTLRFLASLSRYILCKMLPLARSDWLAMATTSSFQLRITHHLKHWIVDFLSFEMVYSMHHLDFRKCSKNLAYFLPHFPNRIEHCPQCDMSDQLKGGSGTSG
ncbi:hypothetical protein AAG906_003319 [Vitis piasezkii]